MDFTEKNIEYIINGHFDGTLNQEEENLFEEWMNKKEFRVEVNLHNELIKGIKEEGIEYEAEVLENININYKNPRLKEQLKNKATHQIPAKIIPLQNNQKKKRKLLSFAAIGLLILGMGFIFWANLNLNNKALADFYHLNPPAIGNRSGTDTFKNKDFENGLKAFFEEKDFEKAYSSFQKITNAHSHFAISQIYLGDAAFNLGKYAEAISFYKEGLTNASLLLSVESSKINWNILLCRLAIGEDIATELDQIINSNDTPLQQKAKALKKQLGAIGRKFIF